jgi:hypothetical protein
LSLKARRRRSFTAPEITVGGLLAKIGMMLLGSGVAKSRMTEELKAVKREAEKLAAASKT